MALLQKGAVMNFLKWLFGWFFKEPVIDRSQTTKKFQDFVGYYIV